jgi:hypothetical protein
MTETYKERVWFSVIYKNTGKKKCDCGWEVDAMNMVAKNPNELTYVRSDAHLMGQVIDVTPPPALPTNEIVVNMDGGVGGSWKEIEYEPIEVQKSLPESELEPFVATLHD